jgi:bifunctional DNase/RNase
MSERETTPSADAAESLGEGVDADESAAATTSAEFAAEDESPEPDITTVFRVMNLESVVFDLGDPSPQVHLMENEAPFRHISVSIALPEAQALYAAMNHITGRRPSTHELTSAILRQLQGDIIATRIVRFEAGVFYAELDVMTPRGRERFDCRTSDGFVLALRQAVPAPILCAEDVIRAFYL